MLKENEDTHLIDSGLIGQGLQEFQQDQTNSERSFVKKQSLKRENCLRFRNTLIKILVFNFFRKIYKN